MKVKSLHDLFVHELMDIYSGEQQLTEALPKMAEKASDPGLADGLATHLEETEGQIERIEQVCELLGLEVKKEKCEAMKGLIKEGETLMKEIDEGPVLDAALITAAQKVEHYEIASYGTLCSLADELGYDEVSEILHETLEEEKATDQKLMKLAEGGINEEARQQAA